MTNLNIIHNYLKENKIELNNDSNGLIITKDKELVIKGSKRDLVDLADIILSTALSEEENDHAHIDDLTLNTIYILKGEE